MHRVVGGHNDARSDRLLSQMILPNLSLDTLHKLTRKKTHHRQVHACIHQSKRIPGCDNTTERWQIFEPAANNLNLGM
jgi:hypothetical protein